MQSVRPSREVVRISSWAPLVGKWDFKQQVVRYVGPDEGAQPPIGIALSDVRLRSGTIATTIQLFENAKESEGRILFGYKANVHPQLQPYYSIGIGGHGFAYVVQQFTPNAVWQPLAAAGRSSDFPANSEFHIRANIYGQKVSLDVDNVRVLEVNLPSPLNGDQLGLFAVGAGPVEFTVPSVERQASQLFVVMQFGEPYDSLYRDVIKPVSEKKGFRAFRADDIYRPGVILQDIIRSVIESEVIVAEITPPNPNVFYELGYAHAMNKTTILLAGRDSQLPFDVRGFRVIYYDDTIRGKGEVETKLEKHLSSILSDL